MRHLEDLVVSGEDGPSDKGALRVGGEDIVPPLGTASVFAISVT